MPTMMSSRLFWKLFLAYAAVTSLAAAGWGIVRSFQLGLWVAVAVGVLAGFVFAWFVGARLIRSLAALQTTAQAIADGDFQRQAEIETGDERQTLADALNAISRQLGPRIDSLERQQRQLEENSERLETVLGAMIEGVLAVDAQERILFANEAAHAFLGVGSTNIVGRPIWEVARHSAMQEMVRGVLKGEARKSGEFTLPRRQTVAALIVTPLPGDPPPGAVLVLHDVTELRRLENLRREFVSNVSHELKTPLTAIQAYTETLLEGALDDAAHNRQFVQRIEEQAHRLHTLILDLLNLAKLESEGQVFEVGPVSVAESVQACLAQRREIAESKGIALQSEAPPGDVIVEADAEGLRTILDNLVDNALNYTPAGGRVTVRWTSQDTQAVIAVEDTGTGIAKEHLARIFERFYRVDRARSRELGGTGLGLSIVKHLTNVFGGSVHVDSKLEVGTTFTVVLPLAR
jgi:two-component system, OmpR family, phosphate regulon sensor histidine kinase PhoR